MPTNLTRQYRYRLRTRPDPAGGSMAGEAIESGSPSANAMTCMKCLDEPNYSTGLRGCQPVAEEAAIPNLPEIDRGWGGFGGSMRISVR
jgi:hypothetical protein